MASARTGTGTDSALPTATYVSLQEEPSPAPHNRNRAKYLLLALTVAVVVCVLVLLIVGGGGGSGSGSGDDDSTHAAERSFFQVSDLHLDLLYNASCSAATRCQWTLADGCTREATEAEFGRYGCNAPEALLHSMVRGMQRVDAQPAFVVLSGDFVAHLPKDATQSLDTIIAATNAVRDAFPGVPLLPAVGNNDGTSHYCLRPGPGNAYMASLLEAWRPWVPSDQDEAFLAGGYYAVNITDGTTALVLNSLLYSPKFDWESCAGTSAPADPAGQLAWLEAQLGDIQARGASAMLVAHIAPVNDEFDGTKAWRSEYLEPFLRLVERFSTTVTLQLYGHYHRDELRVQYHDDENTGSPFGAALLAPSLSPVFYNNPSFRQFFFRESSDGKAVVYDYAQYFADLLRSDLAGDSWRLAYKFRQAYEQQDLSTTSIGRAVRMVQHDAQRLADYIARRDVFHTRSSGGQVCALSVTDFDRFTDCVADGGTALSKG